MRKYLSFLIIAALVVSLRPTQSVVHANSPQESSSPLIITAVYPNAPGSAEKGTEFVTIANTTTEAIKISSVQLRLRDKTEIFALAGLQIAAEARVTIFPSFALPNGGGTVQLYNTSTNTVEDEVAYPSGLTDTEAWQWDGQKWLTEEPNPASTTVGPEPLSVENPETPEESETPEEELPAEPVCDIPDTLTISEIYANPPGTDSEGQEFVELFNADEQSVNLAGCLLYTDKLTEGQAMEDGAIIAAQAYVSIALANKLLNSGGTVRFGDSTTSLAITYPQTASGVSWALIEGEWQTTSLPSPGAANTLPAPESGKGSGQRSSALQDDTLDPCPEGKFRNPETNRCKTVINTPEENELTPCKEGQQRNPDTHRCRAIALAATSSTLTPCDEGEERNPATNRCRKITSPGSLATGANTTPKVSQPEAEAAAKTQRTTFKFVILVAGAALAYAAFEYRRDIANLWQRLKTRLKPPSSHAPG